MIVALVWRAVDGEAYNNAMILIQPEGTIMENDKVLLYCKTESPNAIYSWYIDGVLQKGLNRAFIQISLIGRDMDDTNFLCAAESGGRIQVSSIQIKVSCEFSPFVQK